MVTAVRLRGAGLDVYGAVRETLSGIELVVDVVGVRVRVELDAPPSAVDGAEAQVRSFEVLAPVAAPWSRPRRARRPRAVRVTLPEGEEVSDAG